MGRMGDLRDLRGRWLRLRWGSVAAVAIVALLLGWVGFDDHLDRIGDPHNLLDSLYRALGLFTFEGGDLGDPVPWEIQIARFLAPLTVFAAAVGATLSVFHGEVQRLRAHWFVHDHIVVVGLNARALRLARQLAATGKPAVIVDVVEAGSHSTGARLLGIPVVTANEHDVDSVEPYELLSLLGRTGIHRAEAVVVMTGSPELNARFAYALHNLLDDDAAPRRVFVEMDDVDNLRTATGHSPRLTTGDKGNLEWFSLADRTARSLLDKLEVLLAVRTRPARRHLVVVGRTAVGRSIVVQAARNWSRDLGRLAAATGDEPADRLVLTLIEPTGADGPIGDAGDGDTIPLDHEAYRLHRRDPRVPKRRPSPGHGHGQSPAQAHGTDDHDPLELVVTTWDAAEGSLTERLALPPSAVIITGDSDHELLRLSLDVSTTMPSDVPVWLCAEQSGGLVDVVSGRDVRSAMRPVEVFHAVDTVLREDGILRGIDEELARAVHQAHRRYRNAEATSLDDLETTVPWDDLPPDLRALNHEAVAAWRQVLVDSGYRFVPYGQVGAETTPLPHELVERLAIAMHTAWNDEKKRQGYRPGVRKNTDRRVGPLTHPDIDVPFEALPAEDREWNLVQARLVPEHLAAAGLQLDPLPREQPQPQSSGGATGGANGKASRARKAGGATAPTEEQAAS
jgi:voltage-gated potassium channel Kch